MELGWDGEAFGWNGDNETIFGFGLGAGGYGGSGWGGECAESAGGCAADGHRSNTGVGRTGAGQTANTAPHRTRLILKDGSYQVVMSYQVNGNVVRYTSAERDATEEIPTELVDWDATRRWERQHPAEKESDAGQGLDEAPRRRSIPSC